jgi:suppressor for copper-sensitivity B
VDVTADWCITCKVNKALVLNSGEIRAAFEAKNSVMLQADWTLPDSEIADYLASFGRFGIPFNILYYPDGKQPVIFDELLTKEKIVSALDKLN